FRLASGALLSASPLWSHDDGTIVFRTNRNGLLELYQMSAGGAGGDHPLLSQENFAAAQIPSNNVTPSDWSVDGRNIILSIATLSGYDLWSLPVGRNAKPEKFIDAAGDQMHGNFSPDGHFVAYTTNESGRFEVVVQAFPRSERKWPVSTNGGYEPRWRADG